jgi:hypothetical protein
MVADEVPVPLALELVDLLLDEELGVVELLVVVKLVVKLLELAVEVADVVVGAGGAQLPTSSLMVDAPWPRLRTSVVLTDGGRLAIALLSAEAALEACTH